MKILLNSILFLLLSIILFSCSSSNLTGNSIVKKRRYKKGWHVDLGRHHSNRNVAGSSGYSYTHPMLNDSSAAEEFVIDKKELISVDSSRTEVKTNVATDPVIKTQVVDVKCDTIVFNNGKRILAIVGAVDKDKVTYKLCNSPSGPDFSHETSLINKLQFGNGSEVVVSDYYDLSAVENTELDEFDEENEKNKKYEILSIISFALLCASVLLLFSEAALLVLLALPASLVLGIIGLIKVKKNPKKYKGAWMALTGVIGAGLSFALIIAAILVVLATL